MSGGAERRRNLLTGDWVLISPHRLQRPWQGETASASHAEPKHHDPDCYLCPGTKRAGGTSNPAYTGVWVFDNDYPALLPDAPAHASADPLLTSQSESGRCRVICYTPDHSLTMSRMSASAIADVIDVWASEFTALGNDPDTAAVTIFENRGAMMGASNPHPHGQIWTNSHIPNELARETASQRDWRTTNGENLLAAYLTRELAEKTRIVFANDAFVALVPYWASWPFETLVLPRRQITGLDEATPAERTALAELLQRLTAAYDNLFQTSCPYTMGIHQRPTDGGDHSSFTLHMHFYPPLLRSASVRKFMVGYEMLAMPQRDLTPEQATERLRAAL